MKALFNVAFALFLSSNALGAECRVEKFFVSVTSQFYMFQMPEPELRAALVTEAEPKNRMFFETLLKLKSASTHSAKAYAAFAAAFVNFYGIRNAENPEFRKLDDLELLAIRWYTGDDYRIINSALRGDTAFAPNLSGYISVLDGALEKLPLYQGYTTRGTNLPEDVGNTYLVGGTVSDPSYLSTSILMQYPGQFQIRILSKTGRWIDPISQNNGEGEVLFSRGTRFKVLKREQRAEQIFVELEEVTP